MRLIYKINKDVCICITTSTTAVTTSGERLSPANKKVGNVTPGHAIPKALT